MAKNNTYRYYYNTFTDESIDELIFDTDSSDETITNTPPQQLTAVQNNIVGKISSAIQFAERGGTPVDLQDHFLSTSPTRENVPSHYALNQFSDVLTHHIEPTVTYNTTLMGGTTESAPAEMGAAGFYNDAGGYSSL